MPRIIVQSLGLKSHPLPEDGAVIDCRHLENPHNDRKLRPLTGRDERVKDFVRSDPRHQALARRGLDAVKAGATLVTYYCVGGKHRSVVMAELLSRALTDQGHAVATRHLALARETAPLGKDTAP